MNTTITPEAFDTMKTLKTSMGLWATCESSLFPVDLGKIHAIERIFNHMQVYELKPGKFSTIGEYAAAAIDVAAKSQPDSTYWDDHNDACGNFWAQHNGLAILCLGRRGVCIVAIDDGSSGILIIPQELALTLKYNPQELPEYSRSTYKEMMTSLTDNMDRA